MNEAKLRRQSQPTTGNAQKQQPQQQQQVFQQFNNFDRFSLLQAASALKSPASHQTESSSIPLDLSQKSSRKAINDTNNMDYKQYTEDYEIGHDDEEEDLEIKKDQLEQEEEDIKEQDPSKDIFNFPSIYMNFYNTLKDQIAASAPNPKGVKQRQHSKPTNPINYQPNYPPAAYNNNNPAQQMPLNFISQLPQSQQLSAALSLLTNQNFLPKAPWNQAQPASSAELSLNLLSYFNNALSADKSKYNLFPNSSSSSTTSSASDNTSSFHAQIKNQTSTSPNGFLASSSSPPSSTCSSISSFSNASTPLFIPPAADANPNFLLQHFQQQQQQHQTNYHRDTENQTNKKPVKQEIKKEKIARVKQTAKKPKISADKLQTGYDEIENEFNSASGFTFVKGEDSLVLKSKQQQKQQTAKQLQQKDFPFELDENAPMLPGAALLQPDLVIHGGFGIKNPEYEALNNDVELFNAVEIIEDAENKYKCKICQKSFKLQRLMNRHMKNHSNIKRYLCTFCNKGFNDAFDLKRHTRTHTGVRPFHCSECDRKFTQRCSLESHLNKVHQVELSFRYKERRAKLYVCEDCGITTENPEEHLEHLQKFHPNSPALKRSYDRRIIKINSTGSSNGGQSSMNSSTSNHSNGSAPESPFEEKHEMEDALNYTGDLGYDNGALIQYGEDAADLAVGSTRKKSRKSSKEAIKLYKERNILESDRAEQLDGMEFIDEECIDENGELLMDGNDDEEKSEEIRDTNEEDYENRFNESTESLDSCNAALLDDSCVEKTTACVA